METIIENKIPITFTASAVEEIKNLFRILDCELELKVVAVQVFLIF